MKTKLNRGGRNRLAIMTATQNLLCELSVREVTVEAIARAAGITRSNFYYYFDSKYDVLTTIMAEAARELRARIAADTGPPVEASPARAIVRTLNTARAVLVSHLPASAVCLAEFLRDDQLRAIAEEAIADITLTVIDALGQTVPLPVGEDVFARVRLLVVGTAFALTSNRSVLHGHGRTRRNSDIIAVRDLWIASLWPNLVAAGGVVQPR